MKMWTGFIWLSMLTRSWLLLARKKPVGKLKESVTKHCNDYSIKVTQDIATVWPIQDPLLIPCTAQSRFQELPFFLSYRSFRTSWLRYTETIHVYHLPFYLWSEIKFNAIFVIAQSSFDSLRASDFCLLHSVYTCSGGHPASYWVVTSGFQGVEGPRCELTVHLHLVLTLRICGSVLPFLCLLWCLIKHRDSFSFTFTCHGTISKD
jgi:hypothetical protein